MGGGFVHAAPLDEHPLRAVNQTNLLHLLLQCRGLFLHVRELRACRSHHRRRLPELLRGAGTGQRQHARILYLLIHLIVTIPRHNQRDATISAAREIKRELNARFIRQGRVDEHQRVRRIQHLPPHLGGGAARGHRRIARGSKHLREGCAGAFRSRNDHYAILLCIGVRQTLPSLEADRETVMHAFPRAVGRNFLFIAPRQ